MKTFILCVVATLLIVGQSLAGEKKIARKDIPSAVLSAFSTQYPNATIKGQAKETEKGKTFYEIESVDGTVGRDILYTPDGKVEEVEEAVSTDSLPGAVLSAIKKNSPNGKILKAEKITRDETSRYEITVKEKKGKREIVLDLKGKVVKPSSKGAKEESEKEDGSEEEEEND